MCHACEDCNAEPRNCKTELRRRLVRALEIIDEMKGDVFTLKEQDIALELHALLDNIQRDHTPEIRAWCSVKVYAKVHGRAKAPAIQSDDAVWWGHGSKAAAVTAASKLQAKYKKDHEEHPWWGPWETCGDRFVARLTPCSLNEFKRGVEKGVAEDV